ncbi:MAG: hypothetical protein WDZ75_00165, partial [Candidatus Paceibacterota bacterium]
MNESFETPNNSPENQNDEPIQENIEGEPIPNEKDTPEFNEDRIDRVRLREAIEIAQDGKTASNRFKDGKVVQTRFGEHKRDNFGAMSESELRAEIKRAENENNERDVLQLEKILMDKERGRIRSEDTSAEAPKKSYAERLSELAQEKDPLGLAKVALRETLDELGVKESFYIKAGPFELLGAADKLSLVRRHEEFKRNNPQISTNDQSVYLKGLIYEKAEENAELYRTTSPEEPSSQEEVKEQEEVQSQAETSENEKETVHEVDSEDAEVVPEKDEAELSGNNVAESKPIPSPQKEEESPKEQEAVSFSDSSPESSEFAELMELKESPLLENVIQGLLEKVRKYYTKTESSEDAAKLELLMKFFNKQVENIFSKKKDGVDARTFISKSLEDFLSDTNLSHEEQEPYK